jgi:hypothetical protein
MFFTSDSWLGLGIVALIGLIVVGLALCMGKSIIWFFGTGHKATETSGRDKAGNSQVHKAA